MLINRIGAVLVVLLLSQFWVGTVQASSRWDVLKWCTTNTQEDMARCEGFLIAAVDLRTSDDFSGTKSCFLPGTHLSDVRPVVVAWLKQNIVVKEKSGLALVARAIEEQFPCPK